jgi:hypothetical protein
MILSMMLTGVGVVMTDSDNQIRIFLFFIGYNVYMGSERASVSSKLTPDWLSLAYRQAEFKYTFQVIGFCFDDLFHSSVLELAYAFADSVCMWACVGRVFTLVSLSF